MMAPLPTADVAVAGACALPAAPGWTCCARTTSPTIKTSAAPKTPYLIKRDITCSFKKRERESSDERPYSIPRDRTQKQHHEEDNQQNAQDVAWAVSPIPCIRPVGNAPNKRQRMMIKKRRPIAGLLKSDVARERQRPVGAGPQSLGLNVNKLQMTCRLANAVDSNPSTQKRAKSQSEHWIDRRGRADTRHDVCTFLESLVFPHRSDRVAGGKVQQ